VIGIVNIMTIFIGVILKILSVFVLQIYWVLTVSLMQNDRITKIYMPASQDRRGRAYWKARG